MNKNKILSYVLSFILCFSFLLSPIFLKAGIYTVVNTNDTGAGSLRAAIIAANANGIPDTIVFNITGTGVQTIRPLSQLPQLTDPAGVFIDGFTQGGGAASPGANPPSTATLLIELNGSAAGLSHGLWITSPNNTIQGLAIDSFEQDGIRIEGTPIPTFNNRIYCNFIGTDPTGTIDCGNGWNMLSPWAGVNIIVTPGAPTFAHDNTVEYNLSSGNYAEGVAISSCPPGDNFSNVVYKNYLGTDITGLAPLGNDHNGVYIGEAAHHNIVDSNLISDNRTEGVCILGYVDTEEDIYWYTTDNIVMNNTIGLAVDHSPMGNWREGVSIGIYYGNATPVWNLGYARNNIIGANNIIAHNGRSGVLVWEHPSSSNNADGNQITMNSIYNNGQVVASFLGIDLDDDGVTLNDLSDPDFGANEDLNFPVIDSAVYSTVNTMVYGRLDVNTDPTLAAIEIFKANPDPSAYGEGEIYLYTATPDPAGNWNATVFGLNPIDLVTATTTDQNLNTSEFSFNSALNYITVVSPNGGENWMVDSIHNITWTSNGTSGNVHIEYSIDNGSSWSDVIASTTDDGTHPWTIPDTASDSCLVRVSDTDGNPADVSDSLFSIIKDSVTITSPNGGEDWTANNLHNITWISYGTSGNVHIEYSIDNGSSWTDVIASTADDGTHPWTLPDTASDSCLVRVSDTDGNPSDTSDAVFSISRIPFIQVSSPNGGEDWKIDSLYNIIWTSYSTSGNVHIEYSTDNGSNWSDVIASTTDDGTHPWTIPNTPSANCLVRLSDTDGDPSDTSDAVFTISISSGVSPEGLPDVYTMNAKRITANNLLEISYTVPEQSNLRFTVFDITGKIIKEISGEEKPGLHSMKIDLSLKPVGMYFIRMEVPGKNFTKTDKVLSIR